MTLKPISWIVLNGPSSKPFIGLDLPGPVWGCNRAYEDFDLDHLCLVDQPSIDFVEKNEPSCDIRVRQRNRRYPQHWKGHVIPGIDAGTFAIEQSFLTYPEHTHIIIGADGLLGVDHTTRYLYAWRAYAPRPAIHKQHRNTLVALTKKYSCEYYMLSEVPDKKLRTLNYDTIREKYLGLDGQHTEPEKT